MGERTYPFDDVFSREQTALVSVSKDVSPDDVIDEIEKKCGVGSVLACVPKFGSGYEIVLKERKLLGDLASEHFSVKGKHCTVNELISTFKVISIINLSMYVTDEEIIDRFSKIGVEIVSDIKKRKMNTKTNIYDGTRVFKAKLPPNLASVPYSMKFSLNEKETAYYRVIHNNQVKVCSGCFSAEHLYKDCPEFKCYKCGMQGHISRHCPENTCEHCGMHKPNCRCNQRKRYWGDGFGDKPKRHFGLGKRPTENPEARRQKESDWKEPTDTDDEDDKYNDNFVPDTREQSSDERNGRNEDMDDVETNNASAIDEEVQNASAINEEIQSASVMGEDKQSASVMGEDKQTAMGEEQQSAMGEEQQSASDESLSTKMTKKENIVCDYNVNQDNVENIDYELMSDNVYFIQNDENVKISPPLEQMCSQGEDGEGAFGTLDEIEIDTLPVTSISQGRSIMLTPQKDGQWKIVQKNRRNKLKILPNYKAAKLAHQTKKFFSSSQ